MTPALRSHADNGIWMCQQCGKMIDSDKEFTVDMLHAWRRKSEAATLRELQTRKIVIPAESAPMLEDLDGNAIALARPAVDPTLPTRIHAASVADIAKFKKLDAWPQHPVTLGLKAADKEGEYHINDLGSTIRTVGMVAIVAAPGTGKSTTLIQAAENILANPQEAVVFVRLGNWAKRGQGLMEAVANNPAFDGITARDILNRANENRLTLILDGWNELDKAARDRAAAEIDDLKLDYPLLRIVISTRRQATDLPITGMMIDVQALSDEQQMEIAQSVAGEAGVKVVDGAWRTEGVHDLVAIPLYLNALMTNAPGGVLPTTKEEVLKLFIEGQERKRPHADALRDVLEDNHRAILVQLAVAATPSGNTYLSDTSAKAIVSTVEKELSNAGQFAITVPPPMVVLDTLVNHDILVRAPDGSVGFQHQQLQEWHASFEVEGAMLAASTGDGDAHTELVGMLNANTWEEPILFACERLSRTSDKERDAVAKAIIVTLGIDPMLAADMIYRSSEEVWRRVETEVTAFAGRWHQTGKIDRAVRFAIMSGRPEFAELVWPFVESRDSQFHLRVLRHAPRFRPSVLGADRERRLAALPPDVRSDVLGEIASNSGMDGMELAAKLAKVDADVEVQMSVVQSLMFRRGIRLASDILRTGAGTLWERVAQDCWDTHLLDKDIADCIRQLQIELTKRETNRPRLLSRLIQSKEDAAGQADVERAVYELIADSTFPVDDGNTMYSVRQAFEQYPAAVRKALLERFQSGAALSFDGDDMLRGGQPIDTGPIPEMALSKVSNDRQAAIAASLIGEVAASRMLDRLFALFDAGHKTGRDAESEEKDEYWAIEHRMDIVPDAALAHAWLARGGVEPKHYAFMADLWVTHGTDLNQKGTLVLDEGTRREISRVLRSWAEALIADDGAKRNTIATVAKAIARMGLLEDLDIVERTLDEDLKRKEKQIAEFIAGGCSDQTTEARICYANVYRDAFSHLKSEASSKILEKYLTVSSMAKEAAFAMKDIQDKTVPTEERQWRSGELDAAEIRDRRLAIAEGRPVEETREATAIFAAVDHLTAEGTTEDQHQIALQIVCAATYMPHNRRPELVARLLALPDPWAAKYGYMRALANAGEALHAEHLAAAIAEYYEQAKKHTYLLHDPGAYGLYAWLRLFAFSDHPECLIEVWNTLPVQLNDRIQLENILCPLGSIGHPHAEDTLFAIAAQYPSLYGDYTWVDAVLQLGTETALVELLEMADADPKVMGSHGGYAHERQLHALLAGSSSLRATLLARYKKGEFRRAGGPLEKALAASADADTLLTMVEVKGAQGVTHARDLHGAVEAVVLERRPLGDNSYEIHGVNAEKLRKALFGMIDGPSGELAKGCLVRIDKLRDEHGRVEFEPRHPDIGTGHPWPLEATAG